jgi:hypothetical protein
LSTDVTGLTGTGLGGAAAADEEALDDCWGAAAAVECGAELGEEMDGCLSCNAHSQHTERNTHKERGEEKQ